MIRSRLAPCAALAALLLAATPAAAEAPGPLEPAFANTLVTTYPDGRTARLWLERDGTFRGRGRTGRQYGGRWRIRGDRLCLKQSRPVPLPASFCTPLVRGGVGTSWTARAPSGETVRVRLEAGR